MIEKQFPFTAVVGRDLAKRSLIYHAIEPRLGGTVLMGHRGCAKSTLVRAFREILPSYGINAEKSPTQNSMIPFMEVPLGASEDRLLGSVDVARLTEHGEWNAKSGLLEQAHQGVLYIDEVNLLPDHLVDVILDAAASGSYRLERDGLSRSVESRFILIGTMNPEEGDLRPQLLDRFTHCVMIYDDYTSEERREIVRARMFFEDDPEAFLRQHAKALDDLSFSIRSARKLLMEVGIDEDLRRLVAERAGEMQLEGVRAELGVLRTARSAAAWRGDRQVSVDDIEEGWLLCLAHRLPPQQLPPTLKPPPRREQSSQKDINVSRDQTSSDFTAETPKHAREDAVGLERSVLNANALSDWWNAPSKSPRQPRSVVGCAFPSKTIGPDTHFDWPLTLMESRKRGWKPGKGLTLRFRKTERRPLVWLFLDASRSVGALKFLGAALTALQGLRLRQTFRRFQILLLKDNSLMWQVKRATASSAYQCLESLNEASGKSQLHGALRMLKHAVLRAGVQSGDRILICSDGLFTKESSGSLSDEKEKFRKLLRCLSESLPAIAWLYPAPKRGMRRWIHELVSGTFVKLIKLD